MFNYDELSPSRRLFVDAVLRHYPDISVINRQQIQEVVDQNNLNYPQWFTNSLNSPSRGLFHIPLPNNINIPILQEETEECIANRINERFNAIDSCVQSVSNGDIKALILSGPPGIGKTHEVTKTLQECDCNFVFVSGKVKATGLYKLLYDNRFPDTVLVLDDIDSALDNEDSLNILKKACDLRNTRKISWLTESKLISEEDGEEIPKTFDYEGSIIFITNKDFDALMKKDTKLSPHLDALISRSLYVDLGINSTRDIIVRIKQVFKQGMMREKGFSQHEEDTILDYVIKNADRLREVSLRMCEKIGILYQANDNWESIVPITCFKR